MSCWREFAGGVHDVPCAAGWKAIVAINQDGKLIGEYGAPEAEFDEEIVARLEAKATRQRLQLIG